MSLHPDLLQPLAELVALAARNSQIWVTTHSQEFAERISQNAETKRINLIRTEAGTQVEGSQYNLFAQSN